MFIIVILEKAFTLDLDTWIIPGQILTGASYLGEAVWDAPRDGLGLVKHSIRPHVEYLISGGLLEGGHHTTEKVDLEGGRQRWARGACRNSM